MNIINTLTPDQWQMAGETVLSAVLLSPLMAGVKRWFNVHREFVMVVYVIGGAMLTAAIAYVKDTPQFAPWLVIPLQGLVTFALSQPVYYGLVKPAKRRFATAMADAEKINAVKRSAVLTDDGSLHPATTTDFN